MAINMDETAIKFYVQHRGLIVKRARHVFRPKPTQQVSRAQQRTCVSHVAFVRNNAAAQPSLPQFFISSEHALRVGVMSGEQVGRILGHYTWRALVRRVGLSLLVRVTA